MTDDGWIIVPHWERFQHYKQRDPPWIKTYLSQLDNPSYLQLTFAERGLLHDLRLLYALSHQKVPRTQRKLSARLQKRVLNTQLASLNHAGLLAFSASASREEKRREEESPDGAVENLLHELAGRFGNL